MKENTPPNAAIIVNSAILGIDCRTVIVARHHYVIHPPTIIRIAGAAHALAPIAAAQTPADVLNGQTDITAVATALSWFIDGSPSLTSELSKGTLTEITAALTVAYDLISVKSFTTLLALARNAATLTAKQKQ